MKISIITVVYNDVEHIENTIMSVISQTYTNIEYIVVDGNSTDGTVEICRKYEDKISKLISEPDLGIYNAMNKGIKNASGEWIFFLNSGDVFYNNNVLNNIFEECSNADIIYGKAITQNGTECYFPKKITMSMFILERMVCHQAIFAKKNTFDNNHFNETYKIISDRVWLYNCYRKKNRIERKDQIISIYDTNGVSSNINKFDEESLRFLRNISISFYFIGKIKRLIKHI